MRSLARVTEATSIGPRSLRVTFSDGLVRELDFSGALHGLLATLDSDEVFCTVAVDPVAGTLSWPSGIDLDPDVLHGERGARAIFEPVVLREYHLQESTR